MLFFYSKIPLFQRILYQGIKVRALSDYRKVKRMVFKIGGRMVAEVPVGYVATISIDRPITIDVTIVLGIINKIIKKI